MEMTFFIKITNKFGEITLNEKKNNTTIFNSMFIFL